MRCLIIAVASMFVVAGIACKTNGNANSIEVERQDVSERSGGRQFCFSLTSARDEVLLGEPLTLLVTLENCSNQKQSVPDLLAPEFGLLTVKIQRPGSATDEIYFPAVRRNGRGRPRVDISPGELMFATVPVYFGRGGWQLTQPGLYTFAASYSVDEVLLDSDPIQVYVEEPKGEQDLSAAHTLMNTEAATFFFLGGGTDKGATMLRELVNESPNSPWAAYARMGLAIESASNPSGTARTEACRELQKSVFDIEYDWIIALRGLDALTDCVRNGSLEIDVSQIHEGFMDRHPEAATVIQSPQW